MELEELLVLSEDDWRRYVLSELKSNDSWRLEHQKALDENTALTRSVMSSQKQLIKNTADIVEALKLTKKGVNFMTNLGGWLHKIAKWCLPIVTLFGVIWAILHNNWPRGE